jgi:hypothetical protein
MSHIYYALVGWSARPRLKPSQAIGTSRALPRSPSTRLGCHTIVHILFFVGLMFSPLGTVFPLFIVHTVFHREYSSFLVKLNCCCVSLIKEEAWQLCTKPTWKVEQQHHCPLPCHPPPQMVGPQLA